MAKSKLHVGIYQLRNIINNEIYIGQSKNLLQRKNKHFLLLEKGTHTNRHLQFSYNKYGKDNFKFEVLLYCEPFELTRYEQGMVDRLKPEYNICKECVDSPKGTLHTDEEKLKISLALKGKKRVSFSLEWRSNLSKSGKGRIFTEEHKQKIREASKKQVVTEETRAKMSASRKGKTPRLGTKHSEETKKKISESAKKRWNK